MQNGLLFFTSVNISSLFVLYRRRFPAVVTKHDKNNLTASSLCNLFHSVWFIQRIDFDRM